MEIVEYPVRPYGKSELAQLYTRGSMSPKQSCEWLRRELRLYPGLMERLVALGFTPASKVLTIAQVRAIFEAIGPP